jgi:hypothetical protein
MGQSTPVAHTTPYLQIPATAQLFHFLATEIERLSHEIDLKTTRFTPDNLEHPPEAIASCLQLLTLAALSMHEGLFIPSLKKITAKHPNITLSWDTGTHDTFTLGKFDPQFYRFSTYLQKKLFKKVISKTVTLSLINELILMLISHTQVLTNCNERIQAVIANNLETLTTWDQSTPIDFIFIVISALPQTQLNHLFLFLYPFLPDDLTVKMPEGNSLNVCTMFQSPSQDTRHLIEKAQVYLKLYSSPELPFIRTLTTIKTTAYLGQAFQNAQVLATTKENLMAIRNTQLLPRLRLYLLLSDLFGRLLNAE